MCLVLVVLGKAVWLQDNIVFKKELLRQKANAKINLLKENGFWKPCLHQREDISGICFEEEILNFRFCVFLI